MAYRFLAMNDRLQIDHERIEALAYRIYLQEGQPADHAGDHWQRAKDTLHNLDEYMSVSPAGETSSDHLEVAILRCEGHAISGLALIYRHRPDEGGKFYPASLNDMRISLELPTTLHLDETAETFDLVRLQPGGERETSYNISFRE